MDICKSLHSKIGLKKFLLLEKVKNTVPCTYVIEDLNGKKIIRTFYENKLQKTNQKTFRVEKAIKRKGDKLYIKWKIMIIRLIAG